MILLKIVTVFLFLNFVLFVIMFRRPVTRWKTEVYDCAVVCGYYADEDGTASSIMKTRVKRAVELWKSEAVHYIIMSGGAVYNQYVEAEVMKRYAMNLGVPESSIYVEPQAVSTYHNILHSRKVMETNEWKNCVVVTNGWHLRKADHYARKFRLDYTMCRARNPKEQTKIESIRLYAATWWNMYQNMFRGYY